MLSTKHGHSWYAISWDQKTGQPVLWACEAQWACIETRTASGSKGRKAVDPDAIVPTPHGGLWGAPPKDAPER